MVVKNIALAVAAALSVSAFAFEDEPDELNWDRLGGTLTGFRHFSSYCVQHEDFRVRLADGPRSDMLADSLETVWITPQAFAGAKINQWGFGEVAGEACIQSGAGHLAGITRIGVNIPASGWYRVWARYWHDQGSAASFAVTLEDGRLADMADGSLTFVQDAWSYRFDFTEHARRQNPIPDFRDDPTGFKWESAPMVYLEKGRRTLTLGGLVHGGPFANRNVAAIVLTREPLAVPSRPAGDGPILVGSAAPSEEAAASRNVWERRPMCNSEAAAALRPLWREWRRAFFADLVAGTVPGVEAGRMAMMSAFDEETNLVGTPALVAADRGSVAAQAATFDRTHFKVKIEAEEFPENSGWWIVDSAGASGGRLLQTNWGWWGANAAAPFQVPSNGVYSAWVRYNELYGYLAPYQMSVENADGETLASRTLAADADFNTSHAGLVWVKVEAQLEKGTARVRLYSPLDFGYTYRNVDCVLITDDADYVPEGEAGVMPALDLDDLITVWRARDPWVGYSRLSYPRLDEGLDPYKFTLRAGETETVLMLVRNDTDKPVDATPVVAGDNAGMVSWRVPAFMLTQWGDWQPMPLFRREDFTIPPGETHGLWLTVDGTKAFESGDATVTVCGKTLSLVIEHEVALPKSTPVPYVFGWASPYPMVSCWELYRSIGVNVVNDGLIPKAEADRYGIRLTVHLNDGDISEGHANYLKQRFASQGYSLSDWAWSFMDEPGNSMADYWVSLAKQFRAVAPEVKIWVNPGEYENAGPEACMKMTPYANAYCPYCNHFQTNGGWNGDYNAQLMRQGPKFDILMGYTTPCFGEKASSAPLDMLSLCNFALDYNLDGWAFFALQHGFTYSNSVWDEWNCYVSDQCINIYPGAAYQAISTRNAEAIREAVRRWRAAKAPTLENDPDCHPSAQAPAVYPGYAMAWNDEFNEEGAPYSSDWTVWTPDTVTCTGGALVLTAADEGVPHDGTYASLTTDGKRTFSFGRIEFRVKSPVLPGFHPSMGLAGTRKEYPYGGCFNFFDAEQAAVDLPGGGYSGDARPCLAQWATWDKNEDGNDRDYWSAIDIKRFTDVDPVWTNKFHVWRLDWDKGGFTVSVDGETLWTHPNADWSVGEYAPFGDPENGCIMNVQFDRRDVGGVENGPLPQTFELDYIRYYVPGEQHFPRVNGVEQPTKEQFLQKAKDGTSVELPTAFAWDGNSVSFGGIEWATLPAYYAITDGKIALDAAVVRPVVGQDSQGTVPGIAVADGAVRLNVTNAKAGLYYGYRFAETLDGVDSAKPVWSGDSASKDGDFAIPAGEAGVSGFYRVTVGDVPATP